MQGFELDTGNIVVSQRAFTPKSPELGRRIKN